MTDAIAAPKADTVVDDTWYTFGLRGTGPKDLVAIDVFIPAPARHPRVLVARGDDRDHVRWRLPPGSLAAEVGDEVCAPLPEPFSSAAIRTVLPRPTRRRPGAAVCGW